MSNSTYNGWTNYATWRVNLEIFDDMTARDFDFGQHAYDLGRDLNQYVVDHIYESTEPGLARDYAYAFLSDVNWREIAEHLIEEHAEENAE